MTREGQISTTPQCGCGAIDELFVMPLHKQSKQSAALAIERYEASGINCERGLDMALYNPSTESTRL